MSYYRNNFNHLPGKAEILLRRKSSYKKLELKHFISNLNKLINSVVNELFKLIAFHEAMHIDLP